MGHTGEGTKMGPPHNGQCEQSGKPNRNAALCQCSVRLVLFPPRPPQGALCGKQRSIVGRAEPEWTCGDPGAACEEAGSQTFGRPRSL